MTRNAESLIHHKPIHAVGAVVYRHNAQGRLQILLIKKRKGYWTLPKGKVSPTEDDTSALLRELREETNLTGIVEERIAQVMYITPRRRLPRLKIVTYYLVQVAPEAIATPGGHPGEIIERVRWTSPAAALHRVKRKRIREIIACAQNVLVKRQQGRGAADR
ncbi:MAG: NUDIX domain-containing protein [Roseiflexus sp.]|nr:NUDIX domain-containing protein [Roseiflexus sp.]MBO9336137.1 NUDIX domain-containing protein [Roseiflexus sp.]MBO9363648.1 NUDIX domain-containing protein [Roseiflexus sp.]MBO9381420.1 NUDIX domain-containing protein [Roseiflexus sp.]MBO9387714.1 NUDIX domain-containing protein [Roseiflexus sp.]